MKKDLALWRKYKNTHRKSFREQIIRRYLYLVKYVAGRVAIALPPNVDFDDLVSYGILGLFDAIEKYDLNQGNKFETYAVSRIRGAIMDELRKLDWAPRLLRKRAREIERKERELEEKFKTEEKKTIDYYKQMKKSILAAIPPPPPPPKQKKKPEHKETIFIPPQKIIGKWRISGNKYVGTLMFDSNKGVLVSRVRFFMYNRWDDLFNLTYDGRNVAFDYENPYGVALHFEGTVDEKAREIRGEFLDLKTDQIYPWKAYR